MSLKTRFGNTGNILDFENLTEDNIYVLESPVLTNSQFEKFSDFFKKTIKILDCTFNIKESLKGRLNETLPKFVEEHEIDKVSFINMDCDLYSSTKTVFEYLGPYIKPGTFIYFDEFLIKKDMERNEGVAFAEFLDEYNLDYEIIYVVNTNYPIQTLVKIK